MCLCVYVVYSRWLLHILLPSHYDHRYIQTHALHYRFGCITEKYFRKISTEMLRSHISLTFDYAHKYNCTHAQSHRLKHNSNQKLLYTWQYFIHTPFTIVFALFLPFSRSLFDHTQTQTLTRFSHTNKEFFVCDYIFFIIKFRFSNYIRFSCTFCFLGKIRGMDDWLVCSSLNRICSLYLTKGVSHEIVYFFLFTLNAP